MIWKSLLKYAVPPLAVIAVAGGIYAVGYNNGVRTVDAERTAERHEFEKEKSRLNGIITQKELRHGEETRSIREHLQLSEAAYRADVDRIERDYAQRLRQSAERAGRYHALAEAGTSQCRALASHTAELDSSIVEGRQVVEELRSTLEQRDRQLISIGQQLLADRRLFENYEQNK